MLILANLFSADLVCGLLRSVEEQYPAANASLLLLAIVAPLAAAIALAVSGRLTSAAVKVTAAIGFIIPAFIALWLWGTFVSIERLEEYAFVSRSLNGLESFGISLYLGLNGVSLPLFVLAGIVGLAAGFYALQMNIERLRLMLVLLLVMQSGLMGVFASIDIFFFYFFHEFALIPSFIMIAIWGRRGRKSVSLEFTIYLTVGAMLTLAGLLSLYVKSEALEFTIPALRDALIVMEDQSWIYGLLLIGFGILVSLFPFHSWAPRGYATAPAPVAMLHAGVLKKFGLYGLIQIALPVMPEAALQWAPLLLWLALGNIVLLGMVTIAQRDLKMMLGYSSVMHMGYAFLGLYAYSVLGVGGAIMMMFAHGLSIALLFLLADVIEKRCGSADMPALGGLGQQAPVLMALFVAATMAAIGLPGFANFWGELSIFVSIWQSASPWALIPAVAGIVISAIYGLRSVAAVFCGEAPAQGYTGGDIRRGEKFAALILLIALLVVGFWPRSLTEGLNADLADSAFADGLPHHLVTVED